MGRTACLVLCLALAPVARAADHHGGWWGLFCPDRLPLPLCCPDDYRTKPAPCLPPAYRTCGDDYRPKALPIGCPVKCPGADDYCHKPCPILWPRVSRPGTRAARPRGDQVAEDAPVASIAVSGAARW
jgi:hypothetical protein